jgi:AraC-like DNA-binding protein
MVDDHEVTAAIPPITIAGCWAISCSDSYRRPPHVHEANEFIVVLSGEIHSETDAGTIIARPGDILVFPQGSQHAQTSRGKTPPSMIAVHWQCPQDLLQITTPQVRFDSQGRVRQQTQWLLDIYPSEKAEEQLLTQSLAYSAISELGRLANPAPSDMAERIRRYIRDHIENNITLDDLAREAHMSKYHFSRTLKATIGQTPMRLLSQMRVEEARGLLLQTDLTLEAIAQRVGLSDASHLSHLFRNSTGQSPGRFRQSN